MEQRIADLKQELIKANEKNLRLQMDMKNVRIILPLIQMKAKQEIRSPEKPLYGRDGRDSFFNESDIKVDEIHRTNDYDL